MSSCNAGFKKYIRLKCYDALEREGFIRFSKEGVDLPLGEGFHCWVGLNTGLYSDRVEINPFVGVHVVPIAKMRLLEGRKYDRRVATYAIHRGELAGARNEYAFAFTTEQSDRSVESEATRLAKLYSGIGVGYARSISSYESIIPLLRERVNMLGGYPENFACCLLLMGHVDEACKFVEDFLNEEPSYFRGFAVPFLEMVEANYRNPDAG